jgi:predicted metal-dependent hydrolase
VSEEVPLRVQVVRSARRRRTTAAQLIGDTLHIYLPAWMSTEDEARWIDEWSRRFSKRNAAERIDLQRRADSLARRYKLPAAASVRWTDGMTTRWASCTPSTRAVRISTTVARFPPWVIDYVIVHELAHLRHGDHSRAFWSLVGRYPKAERARGYLIAKSGMDDE